MTWERCETGRIPPIPPARSTPVTPAWRASNYRARRGHRALCAVRRRGHGGGLVVEAFALWKTVVVVQQLHRRWVRGESQDPRMAHIADRLPSLVAAAEAVLNAAGA